MVRLYAIEDCFGDLFEGSWTDKAVAETIREIIQTSVDSEAKIVSIEINQYVEQIKAGLRPLKVEVIRSVATGRVLDKPKVGLTWPPCETEGIQEEREDYIRYFFWAKTPSEAIQKLATVRRSSAQAQARLQEAY